MLEVLGVDQRESAKGMLRISLRLDNPHDRVGRLLSTGEELKNFSP